VVIGWILWNRSNSNKKFCESEQRRNEKYYILSPVLCRWGVGGERVLWKIIEVLGGGGFSRQGFELECHLYVDPPVASIKMEVTNKRDDTFQIKLTNFKHHARTHY
jgi:hypothetical protein